MQDDEPVRIRRLEDIVEPKRAAAAIGEAKALERERLSGRGIGCDDAAISATGSRRGTLRKAQRLWGEFRQFERSATSGDVSDIPCGSPS
jgi:hypothetical protein